MFLKRFFSIIKQQNTTFLPKKLALLFLFLFSDIWEETERDQSDDDDKTDESMMPDESDADEW